MGKVFISKNPLGVFSRVFNLSNSQTKRLFDQHGLYVVRNEKAIPVDTLNFTILQDEILKIGKRLLTVHSDRVFKESEGNSVIVSSVRETKLSVDHYN